MLGILKLFPDLVVEDPKEDLIRWANRSESYMKRCGEGLHPPEGIFDYPDLLERGWGWIRLVTSESSPEDMPTYKKYLKDYYSHNTAESVAQAWLNERDANSASNGTGVETGFLATLAKLCIKAEEKFIYMRNKYKTGPADEINLSKKILQDVRRIMLLEGEFPVAPAALMFITKEAEWMCEWLAIGTYHPDHDWCVSINIARRCALDFLEYKGPESSCVAGLMIGLAKETKTICEAMRKNPHGCRKSSSNAILFDGWDVLETLHGEIFCASQDGAIAVINTVGELTSKENNGQDSCKTKVEDCGKARKLELKLEGDKATGRKDYLAASKLYTQAIELDPADATLYSNRSLCHLQIGEANKALLDTNSCIKIRPKWLKGYYLKGIALMSLKEYKEACDAFLAGVQLDPTNVEMGRLFREAIVMARKD